MRLLPAALLLAALLLHALPTAAAQGGHLRWDGPRDAIVLASGSARVPLAIHYTLDGATCAEDAPAHLQLWASGDPGLRTELDRATVTLIVPSGSHVAQPYTGVAHVNATVSGDGPGDVTFTATTDGAPGCVVVGGETPSQAAFTVHVRGDPGMATSAVAPPPAASQADPAADGGTRAIELAPPPNPNLMRAATAGGAALLTGIAFRLIGTRRKQPV